MKLSPFARPHSSSPAASGSQTRRPRAWATALSALALALGLGACSGGQGNYASPAPGTAFFVESEPNDYANEADFFGSLAPGDHALVEGSLAGFFPDVYDGFAFTAAQPIRVEFFLYHSGFDDFDVCVYDPELFSFVGCFETGANPEYGFVDIVEPGLEFHLVVTPFLGGGPYELELFVSALPAPVPFSASADGQDSGLRVEAPPSEREARDHSAYFAPEGVLEQPVQLLRLDPETGQAEAIELEEPVVIRE